MSGRHKLDPMCASCLAGTKWVQQLSTGQHVQFRSGMFQLSSWCKIDLAHIFLSVQKNFIIHDKCMKSFVFWFTQVQIQH